MKSVSVVMSAYNGENGIVRQVESIFGQKDVNVFLTVRDDGSTDNTIGLLEQLKKRFVNVEIIKGKNVGWRKSFLYALKEAREADYYAFSDQDDVWMEDKLVIGINELEKHDANKPLLYHCNRISSKANLEPIKQGPKLDRPLNKKNALTQEFAQGCSIIINGAAKDLVCRCIPACNIPHDLWTGLICYYFGEVYYDKTPHFYHINHGSNVSGAGHIQRSRLGRIKRFFKEECYPNPSKDLIDNYSDLLSEDDKEFLNAVIGSRKSFALRVKLICDKDFRRKFAVGTIGLKLYVLRGKF